MTRVKPEPKKEVVATQPVNSVSTRTADVIAAEIRIIDAQARQYVLQSAIEIGTKLNEAKELVTHGEWGDWLKSNVNYSKSTANNFMKIAGEYAGSQSFANLNYSQAVALLSLPADEREEFVANNDVEDMSTRELQAAIKKQQELEQQLAKEQTNVAKQKEQFDKWAEQEVKERKLLEEKHEFNIELREKAEKQVEELTAELERAKQEGDAKETAKLKRDIRKAEKEASEATNKATELETALKQKDAEIEQLIANRLKQQQEEADKLLKDKEASHQAEMSKLMEKLQRLDNENFMKFKVQFNQFSIGFNELLQTMQAVKGDEQSKIKTALVTALIGMTEKLK